jgi:hypothetical protein
MKREGLRESYAYYNILVDIGSNEEVRKTIETNSLGHVTDYIETKSFSLIRASLYHGLIGEVIKLKTVRAIEKPIKIARV